MVSAVGTRTDSENYMHQSWTSLEFFYCKMQFTCLFLCEGSHTFGRSVAFGFRNAKKSVRKSTSLPNVAKQLYASAVVQVYQQCLTRCLRSGFLTIRLLFCTCLRMVAHDLKQLSTGKFVIIYLNMRKPYLHPKFSLQVGYCRSKWLVVDVMCCVPVLWLACEVSVGTKVVLCAH